MVIDSTNRVRDNFLMNTQQITRELLETGLTQQKLAQLAGCSQATISSFLNGKKGKRPSFAIVDRLLDLHRARCKPKNCEDGSQDEVDGDSPADA